MNHRAMRFSLVIATLFVLSAPTADAGISDGRSLADACQVLRDATADGSKASPNDPCRSWLFGFFTAYKEDYDARFAAYLSGAAVDPAAGPCFRPPDFISFVDVAGLVVTHGQTRPHLLNGAAEALVLDAMSAAYPCDAAGDAPQRP